MTEQRAEGAIDDLNAALRELIDAVRVYDGPADLAVESTAAVRALAARLVPFGAPGPYMQAGVNGAAVTMDLLLSGDPMEIFPYSPLIGRRNPIAPPLEMSAAENGEVHATVTLSAAYCGPPESVHGGVIAAMFDELLGVCGVVNETGAHTGTLTIVYRSLTPQDEPLALRGWVERVEGRKVFMAGELRHGSTLCAEANGIFIRARLPFLE